MQALTRRSFIGKTGAGIASIIAAQQAPAVMIALRNGLMAERFVENLWRWPTEYATRISRNPSSVGPIELGKWYWNMASNGYFNTNQIVPTKYFGPKSVTSSLTSGYSMGVCMLLEVGTYTLDFTADNIAQIRITGYNGQAGAWSWAKQIKSTTYQSGAYSVTFTNSYPMVAFMFSSNTNTFGTTFTKIALTKKDAFIRITPTTTATHYSPFETDVTYDSTDAIKIECDWRIVPDSAIGTWGILFGNTGANAFNGFLLRHNNGYDSAVGQAPLSTSTSSTGSATRHITGDTTWSKMVFDSSAPTGDVITLNGESCIYANQFFDAERWTRTTQPFYIGEGPRGSGATIATDWKRVKFWKNGTLIRDYIPYVSGGFLDTVGGNILAKNSQSNTLAEYMEELPS